MFRRFPYAAAVSWLLSVSAAFAQATTPANPTSTLQLTSATTAYSAGQLIASSATAGSVVVPSFSISAQYRSAMIAGLRLAVADSTSTAWPAANVQIDLWSAAPTFNNGDRAAWSVATGSGGHLGAFSCTFSAFSGDGFYAECSPNVGNVRIPANIGTVYWTAQIAAGSSSGVTGASKVMTLTAEVLE